MSASPRHPQTTITSRFYNFARLTMFNHCKPMKTRQKIPLLQPFSLWPRPSRLVAPAAPRRCLLLPHPSWVGPRVQISWSTRMKKKIAKPQPSHDPFAVEILTIENWNHFKSCWPKARFVGTQKSNSVIFCVVVTFQNQKIDFDQNCLI